MHPKYRDKIEQLYLEMYEMLIAYACCSLREEALAEEAVQETFRIACQKPENLCESENPKGWLVNTLKYVICNIHRTRENARQILSHYLAEHNPPDMYAEDKLPLQLMYTDIADTEEFKLLAEMAIVGRSHLEMANARGISVDACKKRVQRAKEILKSKMKIDVTK